MSNSTPIIEVAAAVIVHDHKILLAKRHGGHLHDLWEFPGGKLETNETPLHAAERELVEELDIKIIARHTLLTLDHHYPDKSVRLHFVQCSLTREFENCLKKTRSNKNVAWFVPQDFPLPDFCPADKIAAGKIPWEKIIKTRK